MNSSLTVPYKTKRCKFLLQNLNLPKASEIEDAKWEHFQIAHLNNDSIFGIERKSRQIAWSFLTAMEAVADAILDKRDSIFSSINHEEAKEKIRYAKKVFENLEIAGLPKLSIDNQLELEFDDGEHRTRLTSFPARPVRGRPKSNWYGDEFAHVQHDRKIYRGSLPIISKGGRIRIGSSPLGASGLFWEIDTESMQSFPDYTRKVTPWWEVQAFCKNVREARKLAPAMETFERIELFGKDRIKAIFANMLVEDFQQEYECSYVDETTAWISWAEIKLTQDQDLKIFQAKCRDSKIDAALEAVEEMRKAISEGEIENVFSGGMDIGRTRNTTEIGLVGKSNLDLMPLRLMLTLDNCDFDSQETVLNRVMTLPITKMLCDRNGLGRQLAENAEKKFPVKFEGVDFTNATKELWATYAKMIFQQRKTRIPVERDLAYQIHSIKKKVTLAKNNVFDTDRNEKHHADKFWMLALALSAANAPINLIKPKKSKSTQTYW